ncbi:hypothetical protein BH581_06975 [Vibrio splendidus]|uniref:thiamine pyrophosphate-binding protein n=1 Tax=Vibrio splendidus TaxID=29497 RepID=UPI000975FF8D|nr:thiamine pyrophosphate-binding protein [Vibrio splendidus]OMO30290.1 hypothetical protein BH581_06975 [Vibrio splendidus]
MDICIVNEEIEVPAQVSTGSSFILEALKEKNIRHIFMLPGKMVQPFMQDLTNMNVLAPIIVTHETSAGYMADAYARVSEGIGVALSISSPGALNLLPAIASARADGIPILALSGDVPTTYEAKGAFQDGSALGTNDVAIYEPVTGLAARVNRAERLPDYLSRAFERLGLPNKAPAFLQIPLDVQTATITGEHRLPELPEYSIAAEASVVDMVLEKLKSPTSKSILLVGPEARKRGFAEKIIQLAENLNVPVAATLDAKGTFPEDHPLYLGVFGFAGHQRAMEALLNQPIDHVVAFGVNFDQRSTLCWTDELARGAEWFCCSVKLGQFYTAPVGKKVIASPELFVSQLLEAAQSTQSVKPLKSLSWLNSVLSVPLYPDEDHQSTAAGIHPAKAILDLRQCAPRESIVSVDSGSHRVFCAHYWQSYEPNQYLTSASTAPMGWAICAGIAAKLAHPQVTSLVITGDGCMLMHGNEIQTAARYNIPVVFVVLNNSAHGGIHVEAQKHQSFAPELTQLPTHDWKKYAEALGLIAYQVDDPESLSSVYQEALALDGPCLIDVICRDDATVPNSYYVKNNINSL